MLNHLFIQLNDSFIFHFIMRTIFGIRYLNVLVIEKTKIRNVIENKTKEEKIRKRNSFCFCMRKCGAKKGYI